MQISPELQRRAWAADAVARRTSAALAVVATLASGASFFFWRLFERDVPMTVGNMRGTALTVLVIAVPLLVAALVMERRGSARATFAWLAALGYLAYNAVMFCFAVRFNSLFLLFAAMLSLAFWALVTRLRTLDLAEVARAGERIPVRAVSIYLVACTIAWGALWLASVIPASLSNTMPPALVDAGFSQNTVWVLDFAFTFPLMALGALWVWRRRPWGYVIAGTMTIMLTIETAGVIVDQLFGHLHDPAASLGALPPLALFTVAGLVLSALFLARLGGEPGESRGDRSQALGRSSAEGRFATDA